MIAAIKDDSRNSCSATEDIQATIYHLEARYFELKCDSEAEQQCLNGIIAVAFGRAKEDFAKREWQSAERWLRYTLNNFPTYSDAYALFVRLLLEDGRTAEVDAVLISAPQCADCKLMALCEELLCENQTLSALQLGSKLLRLQPDSVNRLIFCGKAIQCWKGTMQLQPIIETELYGQEYAHLRFWLIGVSKEWSEKAYGEAELCYRESLSSNPDFLLAFQFAAVLMQIDDRPYIQRGSLYIQAFPKLHASLIKLNRLHYINESFFDESPIFGLALMYRVAAMHSQAKATLLYFMKTMRQMVPQLYEQYDFEINSTMGQLQCEMGRFGLALPWLQRCVQILQNKDIGLQSYVNLTFSLLSNTYSKLSKYDQARKAAKLAEVQNKETNYFTTFLHLMITYDDLSDHTNLIKVCDCLMVENKEASCNETAQIYAMIAHHGLHNYDCSQALKIIIFESIQAQCFTISLNSWAYYRLMDFCLMEGDALSARKVLKRAVEKTKKLLLVSESDWEFYRRINQAYANRINAFEGIIIVDGS